MSWIIVLLEKPIKTNQKLGNRAEVSKFSSRVTLYVAWVTHPLQRHICLILIFSDESSFLRFPDPLMIRQPTVSHSHCEIWCGFGDDLGVLQ